MNENIQHITDPSLIKQQIWEILEQVNDPEVPVLSVIDLGIIRDVVNKENHFEIIITPTYSGCPAMDVISMNIRLKLMEHGLKNVIVKQVLSPAWTTDWMHNREKKAKSH